MSQSRTRHARPPGDPAWYWRESARPLTSLVFVAPMLLAYEGGVLLVDRQGARNGADVWLRAWLDCLGFGFGSYFLLPILTCALLLSWHHARHESWCLRWRVLSGMVCESCGLALLLLIFAHWQQEWWSGLAQPPWCAANGAARGTMRDTAAQLVAYLGAGIYEELLFRLALLPLTIVGLRWCGLGKRSSIVLAIVLTSGLFSLAHYQVDIQLGDWRIALPHGDLFTWSSFIFRLLAGSFFASLFVARGFGIAVGSHALYDIFAVLL